MIKRIGAVAILLVVLIALLSTTAMVTGKDATEDGSIAASCTVMIVGKDATEDGSVILASNCDFGGHRGRLIHVAREGHKPGDMFLCERNVEIPQVPVTYEYQYAGHSRDVLHIRQGKYAPYSPPLRLDAWIYGINEYQVAVGGASAFTREQPWLYYGSNPDPYPSPYPYGILEESDLRRLILERATTAREAIKIVDQLIQEYGQAPCMGFGYQNTDYSVMPIADPDEGWILELYGGKQWAAVRVPDNMAMVRPNCYGIQKSDLVDPENFMYSENLVGYAIEHGFYNSATDGEFSPSVYYLKDAQDKASNWSRRWRMTSLIAGEDLPKDELIYSVVPKEKLSVKDVTEIMTDILEGTEYDLTKRPEAGPYGNPYFKNYSRPARPVGGSGTAYSLIAQLRSWLPDEIGGVAWWAFDIARPYVYIPWYVGITEFPHAYSYAEDGVYSAQSAWWAFNELANLTLRRYNEAKEHVQPVWENLMDEALAEQDQIDKTALELYKKGNKEDIDLARSYLTSYSSHLGKYAYRQALELADLLRGRYQDGRVVDRVEYDKQ